MVILVDFLLITLAIMFVSILLIYKITNFCGLQLKFQALVLCAILAFVVNFSTLMISAYLTREHFMLIAGLVFASAAAVTFYNERLLHRRRPAQELATAGTASLLPTALPESTQSEEDFPARSSVAASVPDEKEQPDETAPVPSTASEPAVEPHPVPAAPAAITEETAAEPSAPIPPAAPVSEAAAEPADAAVPEPVAAVPARVYPFHRSERSLRGRQRRRLCWLPAVLTRTVADIVREDMENDQLLKLTAVLAKLGSLDDLLDYAFDQKDRHNYSNALFAYKQALSRYHEDSYAPFIVIEMGNIYKNNGAYDDAIHAYRNAMTLAAVTSNADIREEFTKNIDYLRIVKLVLARHHASKLAFEKIPADWQQEIERIFQKRHSQKSVS